MDEDLVQHLWRDQFGHDAPASPEEEALLAHLKLFYLHFPLSTRDSLQQELAAKAKYIEPSWDVYDAVEIVSRTDQCTIALQERTKKEFLDPLSWDFIPHPVVIATVQAILLLFSVPLQTNLQDSPSRQSTLPKKLDDESLWRCTWGTWIVKNIDNHTSGWEWLSTNEPMGLFTKPYALCATHLPLVQKLLDQTQQMPPTCSCWQRMQAYLLLRDWAVSCTAYLHLKQHYLSTFPHYQAIQQLMKPPKRTAKDYVWFELATTEGGVKYYYNRLTQIIALDEPEDFDGGHVTKIPSVILQLVQEALTKDHAARCELERKDAEIKKHREHSKEEWVECFDRDTQSTYYYSFKLFQVSFAQPQTFISCQQSTAFQAVVRLQTAYRKKRLGDKLLKKRIKRSSLPMFSSRMNRHVF